MLTSGLNIQTLCLRATYSKPLKTWKGLAFKTKFLEIRECWPLKKGNTVHENAASFFWCPLNFVVVETRIFICAPQDFTDLVHLCLHSPLFQAELYRTCPIFPVPWLLRLTTVALPTCDSPFALAGGFPHFLAPLCILAMGELKGAKCCPPTLSCGSLAPAPCRAQLSSSRFLWKNDIIYWTTQHWSHRNCELTKI